MKIPHDHDAERSVLAAMMGSGDAAESIDRMLDVTDFHSPAHGLIFDAIRGLRDDRVKPETALLIDRLGDSVDRKTLLAVASEPVSTAAGQRLATVVVEHAVRRRFIAAALELADAARSDVDPDEALDAHIAALEAIQMPRRSTEGLMLLDEIMDRPESDRAPWVVPGLLREDWRAVVVAGEGAGKTLMLQQIAMCASQGIHPFSFKTGYRPVTSLLVDTENPDGRIQEGCVPIREASKRIGGTWEPRTWIWHRPGGLDLRSARDRAAFEEVLYRVQPSLVCAGPSYKLAHRGAKEGWDEVARAVQEVMDKLRTRFRFALLLEDHAPQASGGTRDLRPFGSSMWLRWPELGLKLIRQDNGDVKVEHWREARMKHHWPAELHRGGEGSLPWVGKWKRTMEF